MISEREFIKFIYSIKNPYEKRYNIFSAYIEMFKKYAQFKGRSRRSEYWWAMLAHMLVVAILEIITFTLITIDQAAHSTIAVIFLSVTLMVLILYLLASFVPVTALGVRRLHDTGNAAWLIILPILLPHIGFVFFIPDSEFGIINKYGKNPKGIRYFHLPNGYIESLKNHSKQFIPKSFKEIETYEKMITIISKLVPTITSEVMPDEVQTALNTKNVISFDELAIKIACSVNVFISPQYSGKFFLKWKRLSNEDLMSAFMYFDVLTFILGKCDYDGKNLKFVQNLIALVLINRGIRFVSAGTNDTETEHSSDMPI